MVGAQALALMMTMERTSGADKPRISHGRVNRKVTTKDLRRVNLGKAFWWTKAEDIQVEAVRDVVVRYQDRIDEMIKTASGVLFTGGAGVGKTSAASCLMKKAISRGFTTYFVTHDELREIRFDSSGLFGDGTDGVTVKQQIERAQLLVLDNFNAPFLTDKAFGPLELERLMGKRSARMLTTVMTSRVGASLQQEQHKDLFEALRGCMVPVNIEGKNLRDRNCEELEKRVFGGDDE